MIIPAAGYGTRMRDITRSGSKELVEVGGRPALIYALMEAVNAGLTRTGIIIRPGKEDIVRLVQDDPRLASIRSSLDIRFFEQDSPTGEAGAILSAAAWIGTEPFVVHYPDNIIVQPQGVVAELTTRFIEVGTDLVLLTSMLEHAQAAPCGLEEVGSGLYKLSSEAPAGFVYGLRPTGIYIATPDFLEYGLELKEKGQAGEIKDRDVRRCLAEKVIPIHGLDLGAKVLDIGNPGGYWLACSLMP